MAVVNMVEEQEMKTEISYVIAFKAHFCAGMYIWHQSCHLWKQSWKRDFCKLLVCLH